MAIPDGDFGSGRKQTLHDGKAYAAGATGDDGVFAVEIELIHGAD